LAEDAGLKLPFRAPRRAAKKAQPKPATYRIETLNRANGSVDGHIAGCADIARVARKEGIDRSGEWDVATKHAAWLDYNSDFIAEHEHQGCDLDAGLCGNAYTINWLNCASHVPATDTVPNTARKTSRTTKVQAKPVESPVKAGKFTSKSTVPTKMGAMLLGLIGGGSTSIDKVVKGSSIEHATLTAETAGQPGMPKNGKGVANVIDRLVEQGHLVEHEGLLALTVRGAAEARKQAKVLFSVTNTEGTKANGTPVVKAAKVTTAKAKPEASDPMAAPKVQALVEFAVEQGWTVAREVDGASVEVKMTKDAEVFVVSFVNGSMDASRMPHMLRADGSKVLLRNVSAVKANLMTEADATKAGKASLRVKREVVRGARKVAKATGDDEQPRKALPFDIAKSDDDTVLDLLAGRTVTWRRKLDNGEETATIGRKISMAKANKPGKERIVNFIERVQGKRVTEGGMRSFRLDQIVSVR
jgi:hypothetical protein